MNALKRYMLGLILVFSLSVPQAWALDKVDYNMGDFPTDLVWDFPELDVVSLVETTFGIPFQAVSWFLVLSLLWPEETSS